MLLDINVNTNEHSSWTIKYMQERNKSLLSSQFPLNKERYVLRQDFERYFLS